MKPLRRRMSMMFQDPVGSLSPRMKVGDLVTEAFRIHGLAENSLKDETKRLLSLVGLPLDFADRYPHQLSGGQARRVGVALARGGYDVAITFFRSDLSADEAKAVEAAAALFGYGLSLLGGAGAAEAPASPEPSLVTILGLAAAMGAVMGAIMGAVQGFAGSSGAVASILGLLAGGLLFDRIGSRLFIISALVIFAVFLLSFRCSERSGAEAAPSTKP